MKEGIPKGRLLGKVNLTEGSEKAVEGHFRIRQPTETQIVPISSASASINVVLLVSISPRRRRPSRLHCRDMSPYSSRLPAT
jgi:hypothetical protein